MLKRNISLATAAKFKLNLNFIERYLTTQQQVNSKKFNFFIKLLYFSSLKIVGS